MASKISIASKMNYQRLSCLPIDPLIFRFNSFALAYVSFFASIAIKHKLIFNYFCCLMAITLHVYAIVLLIVHLPRHSPFCYGPFISCCTYSMCICLILCTDF